MLHSTELAAPMTAPGSDLAPVVVFAYARRDHLQRTIESLQANAEAASTDLYVYCDGAKAAKDQERVDAVRDYVASISGFASVRRVYSNQNLGLARSIIDGVSDLLSQRDRLIVVEDDLLLSPHFLRYMNDALACYADDSTVASIHGYCYPTGQALPPTFFIKGADCWGWATWSRAWQHFEPDGRRLLEGLRSRGLTNAFDFDGRYPFTTMLEEQMAGRNDSWAIRWHASCYLRDMLTLYPGRSVVENIGNDGTGTHSGASAQFSQTLAAAPVIVDRLALTESATARQAFTDFFRRRSQTSMLRRWSRKLKSLVASRA